MHDILDVLFPRKSVVLNIKTNEKVLESKLEALESENHDLKLCIQSIMERFPRDFDSPDENKILSQAQVYKVCKRNIKSFDFT